MNIYHYADDGYYLGSSEAEPSPFRPNEWLIPANGTMIAPPSFDSSTEQARWTGEGWEIEPIPPEPEPEPSPEPPTPQPNWKLFLAGCIAPYSILATWAQVNRPQQTEAIRVATSRLSDAADLALYATVWNAAFMGCGQNPALADEINAAAEAHNIPLSVGSNFELIAGDSL